MAKQTNVLHKLYRAAGLPVAILPIAWIFWRLDFKQAIDYSRQIAWWTIPVLCALILFTTTLQGVRWWIMLRSLVPDLSLVRTLSYHFIGIFYGIVLPTSASGDVIKTVLLSRKIDYSVSWGATWLCRIMGILALALFSFYGLITIDRRFLPDGVWIAIGTAFALIMAVFVLSFSKRITSPFRPIIGRMMPAKAVVVIENIRQGIFAFRNKKGALLVVFLVTMLTQAMVILLGCLALYGIAGKFHLLEYFAFLPIIEVIANAGPTPNGLGTREALTVLFFNYLHISNEHLGIYVFITIFLGVGLRLVGVIPVFHGMMKSYIGKRRASNRPIL